MSSLYSRRHIFFPISPSPPKVIILRVSSPCSEVVFVGPNAGGVLLAGRGLGDLFQDDLLVFFVVVSIIIKMFELSLSVFKNYLFCVQGEIWFRLSPRRRSARANHRLALSPARQ